MAHLTASVYRDLCALAGDAVEHSRPLVQEIGTRCDWPVAIYLLAHRDPGNNALIVDYVGSAVRLAGDVAHRVREHLKDAAKQKRFTSQIIIPLRRDTEVQEVRRLEGVVARALGVPRWCKRIPGGRRGPTTIAA